MASLRAGGPGWPNPSRGGPGCGPAFSFTGAGPIIPAYPAILSLPKHGARFRGLWPCGRRLPARPGGRGFPAPGSGGRAATPAGCGSGCSPPRPPAPGPGRGRLPRGGRRCRERGRATRRGRDADGCPGVPRINGEEMKAFHEGLGVPDPSLPQKPAHAPGVFPPLWGNIDKPNVGHVTRLPTDSGLKKNRSCPRRYRG